MQVLNKDNLAMSPLQFINYIAIDIAEKFKQKPTQREINFIEKKIRQAIRKHKVDKIIN